MVCATCGAETKTEHAACPACGNSLYAERMNGLAAKKGMGGGAKFIAGIVAVLLVGVAGLLSLSCVKGGGPTSPPPIASQDSRKYNEEDLRDLVRNYTQAWEAAVNKNDFALAEKFLLPGSELFNSQKELQSSLKKDGIRLQHIKTDVGNITAPTEQGVATINVLEEYNVRSTDGKRQVSRCYWTYTANYVQDQGWKLSKLVETPPPRADFNQPAVIMREYNQDWIRLQYPQLENLLSEPVQNKINAVLKKSADDFAASMRPILEHGKGQRSYDSYSAESSYSVKWQTPDILSIVCYSYQFTGGAHGISTEIGYTFDLKTGDLISLRNKVGEEKIRAYNDTILQQIRARKIPIFEPYQGIGDKTTYYLKDNKTLVVVFQQYEIGPYSSGILRFEVPY